MRRAIISIQLLAALAAGACTPFDSDGPASSAQPDLAESGTDEADSTTGDAPTDGSIDSPGPTCGLDQTFGQARFVPGFTSITGATWIGGLRLSPDLETGYYHANGPDAAGGSDLYVATRPTASSPFDSFMPLPGAGFNTVEYESNPTVSGDGLTIVFERSAAGNTPTTPANLYYGTRSSTSDPFVYSGPLEDIGFDAGNNWAPFLRQDGQVLYFVSDRDSVTYPSIYRSVRDGSGADLGFGPPAPVAGLTSGVSLASPAVTPDDLTLYFAETDIYSDGGASDTTIWVATRSSTSDAFGNPENVSELTLTTKGDLTGVLPSFVTVDDCNLYFFSYLVSADMPYGVQMQYYAVRGQ
ncbi:MAG TPA: hypothetical protein VEK07_23475 [Polyangiaceae bacterium]|nr:hypothetical protein [Polyangiaceae bacterium]